MASGEGFIGQVIDWSARCAATQQLSKENTTEPEDDQSEWLYTFFKGLKRPACVCKRAVVQSLGACYRYLPLPVK